MTTSPPYTVQAQAVYTLPLNTLDPVPLTMPGAIASRALRRVWVWAAAARLAVHQACAQRERAPSGPPVLGTLARQCSALDALEGHVQALWARLIPQGLGHRGRRVAVDVVALPSQGPGEEAHHDEVCRRKAQGGTTHFCTYATAYAVVRGRRSPLARCQGRATQTMAYGLRTLLARLVTRGMRLTLLWLDRGCYSVRGSQELLTAQWPFLRPAVKRGKKPATPGGPTGTGALAAEPQSPGPTSTLQRSQEGQVAWALAVVWHHTRGQRGRHQREALLSATWGLTHRPLRWLRAT